MPIRRRALGLSIAATLLSAPVLAPPAQAAFPGADGRIAFVRAGSVYTATTAGGDLRLVARNGAHPRWSPDGTRIAMVRAGNVWVMNADGTRQVQATRTGGIGAMTWSPDGAWLAAVHTPAQGPTTVSKVRSTAPFGPLLTVTSSSVENRPIAWSPDGASIAFSGGAFDDTYPCVNDGLVCISTVDIATGAVDVLTFTGGSMHSTDDIFAPDWRPDSSGVLFSFVQVARDYTGDSTPLHVSVLQPSRNYTTDGGVYSPSGTRVAFTKRTGTRTEVFTATAEGTGWYRVAAGQQPDWQPTSR